MPFICEKGLNLFKNNDDMHFTVELPYDLESQLREQAAKKGKALNQYITGLIKEKINSPKPVSSTLTADETRLFTIINQGFSDDFWAKLNDLNQKRQQFTLLESERQELITLTEALESAHLDRMKALIELSAIRQVDLDVLMHQLGLTNGKHN
jgi:hypothetical protein